MAAAVDQRVIPEAIRRHERWRDTLVDRLPRRLFLIALTLGVPFCFGCGTSPSGSPPSPSASTALAPISSASSEATQAQGQTACGAARPNRFVRANESPESASVELVQSVSDKAAPVIALVADADERALHAIDTNTMEELGVTPLPGIPEHVLALRDGRVAVTLRDTAHVIILEPGADFTTALEERCQAAVAIDPWALAESAGNLYVTSGFGAELAVFRSTDMAPLRSTSLPREPRAIVIDPSGKTAFIAHAVGGVVSAIDLEDASKEPAKIDIRAGRRTKTADGAPEQSREADQGYSLTLLTRKSTTSGETFRLLVPNATVDPGIVGNGISGGSYGASNQARPIAPIVSVIDPATRHPLTANALMAGVDNQDCVLPRSAVVHDDKLYVACLDGAVLELDPWLSDPMIGELRRFKVPRGPSGIAVTTGDNGRLLVWSELDRQLSRIDIADQKSKDAPITSISLWERSTEKRDLVIERGKRLFHSTRDVRLSQGRACASCHPEGRDDGIVWSSPDGARQTPMLAGRIASTAPYGWFGENATLREHFEKTFERLGGTGLKDPGDKEDLDALIAYVTTLPAPPPEAPPDDTASITRGKNVFVAAGCGGCHKDGGTDGKTHDVGTGVKGERKALFDTPSLKGLRGSAPYFHDGRHAKLEDVLTDKESRMIDPTSLSEPDRKALIAYLRTL